jgi:hypothetical protein
VDAGRHQTSFHHEVDKILYPSKINSESNWNACTILRQIPNAKGTLGLRITTGFDDHENETNKLFRSADGHG